MSNVIPFDASSLPAKARAVASARELNEDLTAGAGGAMAIMSIRGSKFRISTSEGQEVITDADGDPVSSLKVVLVKANKNLSKTFYRENYTEGDDQQPDCRSANGETPDADIQDPVHSNCAACPNNVFGSRMTEDGGKGKACQDSRRMAIVAYPDILSEQYGGTVLLRVPPASLRPLGEYARLLSDHGAVYSAVVTKLSFDPETSYPKLRFQAVKPLSEEEYEIIEQHMSSSQTDLVLQADKAAAPAQEAAPKAESIFIGDDDEDEAPAPAPAPKPAAKKAAAKPKAEPKKATPVEEPEVVSEEDEDPVLGEIPSDLDAAIDQLLG